MTNPAEIPSKHYYKDVGFSVQNMPDLAGKVAIVTGGNTGLGYETILALVKKNCRVFMASRSKERADTAIQEIKNLVPTAQLEFLSLDLQDLKSVAKSVETFVAKKLPLHILINNAGIMACPFALSKDGIETQFATNHVAHFLFTTKLIPTMPANSRIVNLSSLAHIRAPPTGIDFEKINDPEAHTEWIRYGQSKLANILFSRGLTKRFPNLWCNSVHPGVVRTELMRGPLEAFPWLYWLTPVIWLYAQVAFIGPDRGALTQLYAATSPEIESKNLKARYFVPFGYEIEPTELAKDDALADKLWDYTEKLVAEKLAA